MIIMEKGIKQRLLNTYRNEFQLVFFSILVGILVGAIVGLYNIAATYFGDFSVAWYEAVLQNLWAIPLLFLALFSGAVCVGVALKLVPMARGSGIPQIEGAARGLFKLQWFRMLVIGIAASLATIILGLSAGSEGPSMLIGGTVGDGTGDLTKRNANMRRYLLTGGASAGLAAAFNAPLTGFIFAFEEAHKKFTPEILISAFFSVISGILTRNAMRAAFGLPVTQTFLNFDINCFSSYGEAFTSIGFVLLAAIVVGLAGAGTLRLVRTSRKLFAKITFFKGIGKFFIPFTLAGIFGLISIYEMGGGHHLIEALGSLSGETVTTVFTGTIEALVVSLIIILIMKFIATVMHLGSGMPCGSFIPMLAIGALIGALLSRLFVLMGMNGKVSDLIVIICLSTYFAAVVKAPLTAIVMAFELTGSFSGESFLIIMLGVSVGYMTAKLFGSNGIYDMLLDGFVEEHRHGKSFKLEHITATVGCGYANGRQIRDIIWPNGLIVESVCRGGESFVPDGQSVITNGDELTIAVKTYDVDITKGEIDAILGT